MSLVLLFGAAILIALGCIIIRMCEAVGDRGKLVLGIGLVWIGAVCCGMFGNRLGMGHPVPQTGMPVGEYRIIGWAEVGKQIIAEVVPHNRKGGKPESSKLYKLDNRPRAPLFRVEASDVYPRQIRYETGE